MGMNRAIKTTIYMLLLFSAALQGAFATVSSVTVTAAPRSVIGGVQYYLAGQSYTFRVQATSANTMKSDWNSIVLNIDNSGVNTITISVDTDTQTAATGLNLVGVVDNSIYATGNLDYDITVMVRWDATELANAARNVSATVSDDTPSSLGNNSAAVSFGVSASVKAMNFVQTGAAGDAKITPLHDTFNVTGVIVYNVASATALDTIPAGNIASVSLLRNPGAVATGFVNGAALPSFSFPVSISYFNGPGLGNYTWQVRVVMQAAVGGTTEDSANTLAIRCDRVRITDIQFLAGGGVSTAPNYWRSTNVPGVTIRVFANMENGAGNVEGNTIVRIRYDYGAGAVDTDVTILSGAASGDAVITYPVVAAGNTLLPGGYIINYRGEEIIGGPYDEIAPYGQHVNTAITQDPTQVNVYWDNVDPPRNFAIGSVFATTGVHTTTASSLTLNWTPLVAGGANGDFSSYKIYVKRSVDAVWNVINSGTDPTLGIIGTSSATVLGLVPFTNYDYRLSAIDVFGNETALGDMITGTIGTKPVSVAVTLSDGILQHADASFATYIPATVRPLRNSAIRVTLDIVTAGTYPDQVNLHIGNALIPALPVPSADRINCSKTAPNRYVGYIPTTHPYNIVGGQIWFVVEMIYNGVSVFVDHDGGASYIDYEWNFFIDPSLAVNFTPWPTRILNNVITDANPVAYPSYYLTDNAFVTIEIYDIKGRHVATLLDRAPRLAGQNIKDQGWNGTNKANRKVGVGLYYIHIKAERQSDGKTIISKFEKVVMAR